MLAKELRDITTEICGDEVKLMAETMGLAYRTFQDYVYGKRAIPDAVAAKAVDILLSDRAHWAKFKIELAARMDAVPHMHSSPDQSWIEKQAELQKFA